MTVANRVRATDAAQATVRTMKWFFQLIKNRVRHRHLPENCASRLHRSQQTYLGHPHFALTAVIVGKQRLATDTLIPVQCFNMRKQVSSFKIITPARTCKHIHSPALTKHLVASDSNDKQFLERRLRFPWSRVRVRCDRCDTNGRQRHDRNMALQCPVCVHNADKRKKRPTAYHADAMIASTRGQHCWMAFGRCHYSHQHC